MNKYLYRKFFTISQPCRTPMLCWGPFPNRSYQILSWCVFKPWKLIRARWGFVWWDQMGHFRHFFSLMAHRKRISAHRFRSVFSRTGRYSDSCGSRWAGWGSPGPGRHGGMINTEADRLDPATQRDLEREELVHLGAQTQTTVAVLAPHEQITCEGCANIHDSLSQRGWNVFHKLVLWPSSQSKINAFNSHRIPVPVQRQ